MRYLEIEIASADEMESRSAGIQVKVFGENLGNWESGEKHLLERPNDVTTRM